VLSILCQLLVSSASQCGTVSTGIGAVSGVLVLCPDQRWWRCWD